MYVIKVTKNIKLGHLTFKYLYNLSPGIINPLQLFNDVLKYTYIMLKNHIQMTKT